jgi:GWxTD domain-containing protein
MRRLLPVLFAASVSLSVLSAATLPELYQKTKEQFRLRDYSAALATIERVRSECQKPENEKYRASLQPAIAFYRGASLAALGRAEEARPEFEIFLAFEPNASLDPAIYPRTVIAALDETRKALQQKRQTPEETGAMATAYRAFKNESPSRPDEPGPEWADGPVRVLLTADQRRDYERLADPVSRSEFITAFWKARDPRPETIENEFRMEFERRVAYADTHFTDNEVRGSMTDRGMVFLLMGPPTYIGRRPIATGEDSSDPSGMSFYTKHDVTAATAGLDPRVSNVVADRMTGPNNLLPSSEGNWREVWHYRRELLPRGVPYQQVDVEFITRKGYGVNVLQRNSDVLASLEAARKGAATGEQKASR